MLPLFPQIQKTGGPVIALTSNILKTFSRSYYKEKFFYDERYTGLYDGHNQAMHPRRLGAYKEEELLDEVHALRAKKIENPSPFHVITRIRGFCDELLPWHQRVTLRRLNIHSTQNGDVAVVPNTPQFNELINKVKHLLHLKPAVFANGQPPTEEDIGALKVCPQTGLVTVDQKLRMRAKRVNLLPPVLFQGRKLRYKLYRLSGINSNHYMR